MAPHATRSTRGRGWARRAPAAVLVTASLVLSAFALLHEGVTTTEVDVNDGGIWVTNQSRGLVGHLNYDSRTLDAALRADSTDFDIAQYADTVTLTDHASRAVAPVEVAAVRLGAATSLTERAEAVQGGDRLGVLDAGEGTLWVASAAEPSSTPLTAETAVADDLEGGVVSAGVDGTVMAVSATTSRITTVTPDGDVDRVATTEVEGLPTDARLSLTAVGSRPVALDASSNTLLLPDGRTRDLSAEGVPSGGVLQEPGPEADDVLLATADALVRVPLDGSAVTTTPATRDAATGRPARPVHHQGCDYAAWAGSGAYVRVCEDPTQDTDMVVDTLKGAGDVQFRTNRTRIVLNDIGSGSVWLPDQHMVLMDDWDQVEAELKAAEQPEDSPQLTDEIVDPERKETNTPPEAVDDDFGIRPGRTTTLPVLQNDSDPDGDVLTARPVTQPTQGSIHPTRGGQALQVTGIGEDATGTLSFTYEASDGQAVDTASVHATVHPWDVNSGPTQLRDPGLKLGAGAEVEYNVLPDWIDPDGDPIFLQSATAPEGIQVSFREEGTVSVRDLGAQAGSVPVEVVVSDGREATTGTLTVLVQPQGNLAPTANADFYVARVGEPQTIEPLANDTDPNGDSLTLVGVSPAPTGTTVVPDLDLGTLTFTAQSVGTHQFTYTVTDGPSTAVGVVRVDVVDDQADAAPVAEDDLVVLPAGGAALSAPLDNDADPAGGVLVVQSLDLPEGLPLEVTLVDRHLLRITAPGGLDQAVSFSYTVSNGAHSATARVTVVPTAARDDKQPPELQPDRVKVRVGDIASVPVLQNDRSPAGLALRVDPELQYTPEESVGRPFVTGNLVRLEAGDTPGVLHVAYTVRDSAGNMGTSTVMFEVVALDGANAAPRPRPLTAWAVSGQTARIPVPLNGIDPDGDSVTLVGIAQAPQKGTVALGVDWLEYTPASSTTGTDVFTYIVEDRQGKQATARVRVGVAPPSDTNQNPTAVRDTVLVRPDRQVAVAVLANDIDADGDPLSLVPDSLGPPGSGLVASQRGNLVVVTSPSGAGSHLVTYRISDGRGGHADGSLTVNVSPDAPLQPPVARDDVVALGEVPTDGSPVRVDVLANDEDPDGDVSELVVSTRDASATVSGRDLLVTPTEKRGTVVYTVTDADGLSASAVVSVPGTGQARPRLDDSTLPLEVRAGQDVVIDIADHVITRTGRTPRIVDASTLRTSVGIDPGAKLIDPSHIALHVSADHSGKSSLSFEVRDGDAEDRSALSAVLSLPLTVRATTNQPPTLTPTPIRVAAGEEAVSVDLAPMVTDPDGVDPATFTYALTQSPEGLQVSLEGHVLSVRAAVDRHKGPAGAIGVTVDDGSGAVSAQVPVSVVASTRPLIQVSDAVVTAARAGGTERVDLTGYTINPFPETPLRVIASSVQVGQGTVDPQGTTLHITPAVGFHGQMTVGYRLMDATGDPQRVVEGQVRLVVRDRPEAPGGVTVTATGAGSALVTFRPGSDNGAPITSFTLSDVTTGQTFTCTVASCPVTGLENGVRHSFSVVAHNDVGASDASAASAPVLVDMRPGRPNPPTGTAGDGSATIRWTPPVNEGSALTGYTVFVVGPGNQEIPVPPSQTSLTVGGLVNGQAYRFSVRAQNRSEQPSEVSEVSGAVIPFGVPPAPGGVNVENLSAGHNGDMARIRVSWSYPGSSNGRPFDRVRVTAGGVPQERPVDGSQTSLDMDVPPAEDATVTVELHTEGGWSPSASTRYQAVTSPMPLDAPRVSATGNSGELDVSGVSVRPGNGYRRGELTTEVSRDGGGTWEAFSGGRLGGFTNGQPVTLVFRQVADSWQSVPGPTVSAAQATPYGPPLPARISAEGHQGGVTITWDAPTSNGGPQVTSFELMVDGRRVDTGNVAQGNHTVQVEPGTRVEAWMRSVDSEGREATSDRVSARSWGTVSVQPSACVGGEQPAPAQGEDCHSFEVRAERWPAGQVLTCTFVSDIDNLERRFDVGGSWTASRVRTAVTDPATMGQWVGSILSCTPRQ